MKKPSLPKGTRDFLPSQMAKRAYIFNTIESVFKKYAYVSIETPAMENLNTLTGKYGEEGDKLLFKVLNNGDFLAKADSSALENRNSTQLIPSISKRGLRYDLTVPFARFVVMNQHHISFPFKRYQIQPVWRADRPQKGRYQEFYQCDVDVVGSESLVYEAELIQIYDEVFSELKIPVSIRLNNRKILMGLAEVAGIKDQFIDMTMAIDKLDKIGIEGVRDELARRGIGSKNIDIIESLLNLSSLEEWNEKLSSSEVGMLGVAELEKVFAYLANNPLNNKLLFDPTLARGLSYYTGCILEVNADHVQMGSIGGGGRYDNLTGSFGLTGVSGVGVSFGAERIYDVLESLDQFPEDIQMGAKVLLIAFDNESHFFAYNITQQLRSANIAADIYPEPKKLQKQMKYANANHIPFVILIGQDEMESGLFSFKNMNTGEQSKLPLKDIIKQLS